MKLLHKYILALTNLYGIVHIDKVLQIYNSQNKSKITRNQLKNILEDIPYVLEYYDIVRYYSSFCLADLKNYGDMKYEKKLRAEAPFYIPDKDELLKYADPMYIDENQSFKELEKFFRNEFFPKDPEHAYFIARLCQAMAANDYSPEEIEQRLMTESVRFIRSSQKTEFLRTYVNMADNARRRHYNGHTRNELIDSMPEEAKIYFEKMISKMFEDEDEQASPPPESYSKPKPVRSAQKIGRNAPCPCGSGKKYKKCCMNKDSEVTAHIASQTDQSAHLKYQRLSANPQDHRDYLFGPKPKQQDYENYFQAMARIAELQPWNDLQEDNFLVLDLPGCDQPYFISVMGGGAIEYAITAYRGEKALDKFYDIVDLQEYDADYKDRCAQQAFFTADMLQASFNDRIELMPPLRKALEGSNLKFLSQPGLPNAHSFRAGYNINSMNRKEMHTMTIILNTLIRCFDLNLHEKIISVSEDPHEDKFFALKLTESPFPPEPQTLKKSQFIIDSRGEGHLIAEKFKYDLDVDIREWNISPLHIDQVRKLPRTANNFDYAFLMNPGAVQDRERPYFTFQSIIFESASGRILSAHSIAPLPNYDRLLDELPRIILEQLTEINALPQSLNFEDEALSDLMEIFSDQLNITTAFIPGIQNISEYYSGMIDFLNQ